MASQDANASKQEALPAFDLARLDDPDADPVRYDAAWRELFGFYDPRLRAYFATRGVRSSAMDDLLAGVWERAYRHIGTVEGPEHLWGWLRRIGTNALLDDAKSAQRRRVRERKDARLDAAGEAPAPDPLARLCALEPEIAGLDAGTLRERFARLSPVDQQYATLFAVDELSHAEAAAACGLPSAEAGKKRWLRIRDELRREP
jgi:DNA-directed RNA polymerase specialized sigma24 family protein